MRGLIERITETLNEDASISQLQHIAASGLSQILYFRNGTSASVDKQIAKSILNALGKLNSKNQEELVRRIETSDLEFFRVVDFAFKALA